MSYCPLLMKNGNFCDLPSLSQLSKFDQNFIKLILNIKYQIFCELSYIVFIAIFLQELLPFVREILPLVSNLSNFKWNLAKLRHIRVPTRQGKVREICFFFKVREKSGNL